MTVESRAVSTTTPAAEVLAALDRLAYPPLRDTSGLAQALGRAADGGGLLEVGPSWWNAFDQHARGADWRLPSTPPVPASVPAWRRLLPTGAKTPGRVPLPPFWEWALAVCAADGRTRQAALAPAVLATLPAALPTTLPAPSAARRGLIALLVVRCADWVAPVRTAAEVALAEVLAEALARADFDELVWAARTAWAYERRQRGAEAVRIVVGRLAGAPPVVWDALLGDPDFRVRRLALAQAIESGRCTQERLLAIAVADADVLAAQRAADHVLRSLVPPGTDGPAGPRAETALRQLLASRIPGVRAAAVTVLRRAQRPDLAEPFTGDRSASVREVARWVLRSCGQDPALFCRARLACPSTEFGSGTVGPGTVSGLAECGDVTDAALLRGYLTHERPKVRSAALRALGAMRPSAITPEEIRALMEQDPAPGVVRTAAELLDAVAGAVPREQLDTWLAPGRSAHLRTLAARMLRATGAWNRLEVDLRLLRDEDEGLAVEALQDARVWARAATVFYQRLADGQRHLLVALLDEAVDLLDPGSVERIRFAFAHALRP